MQNETKLVFELFGELTANQSVENRTNSTCALRLRHTAVLEASRHHRSCSAMPEAKGLRLDKCNTLLYRVGIIREQAVTQRKQLSLVERLEIGCLGFHRDVRREGPSQYHFCSERERCLLSAVVWVSLVS